MRKAVPAIWIIGLLVLVGCQAPDRDLKPAGRPETGTDALVNTVWMRADDGGTPGEMRIFLADGTLVMDSCWEVYALRTWRRVSETEIVLVEDVEVPARIVSLTSDDLRLSLSLVDGSRQEIAYRRGQAPYLCPEMKG